VGPIYHFLVARKTRGMFEKLNEADAGPFVAAVHDDVVFTYPGKHALGGTMRGKAELSRWFERFFGFFPGIHWTVKDITVDGPPWGKTVVAAEWSVRCVLDNGYVFDNDGLHIIELRNAKASAVRVYLDTQRSAAALKSLAESGVADAVVPQEAGV
jgi:ketosteroid isomerase-like protein